jgi:hypothetical protein
MVSSYSGEGDGAQATRARQILEGRRCSVKLAKRIAVAVASLLTLVLAGGAHVKL